MTHVVVFVAIFSQKITLHPSAKAAYLYVQHTVIDKDPELVSTLKYLPCIHE